MHMCVCIEIFLCERSDTQFYIDSLRKRRSWTIFHPEFKLEKTIGV